MMLAKKLLTFLITVFLLSFMTGSIAYASESDITAVDVQSTIEGGTEVLNADNMDQPADDMDLPLAQEEVLDLQEAGEETSDMEITAAEVQEDAKEEISETDANEEVSEAEDAVEALKADAEQEETEKQDTSEEEKQKDEKPSYSKKDLRLLSSLVFSEAENQTYEGMLGVANIVLNRVDSKVYSHVTTIKEAIYDKKWSVQFAVTIKSKTTGLSMLDKALKLYDTRKFTGPNPEAQEKAMKKAIKAVKAALEGTNNIGGYLCFQNKRSAGSIKKKYSDYKIIDDHIFYRTK